MQINKASVNSERGPDFNRAGHRSTLRPCFVPAELPPIKATEVAPVQSPYPTSQRFGRFTRTVAIETERAISGHGGGSGAGSLGVEPRPAAGDPHRQRQRVLRQGHGDLGVLTRRTTATDRTGQAEPERLRRVLQRQAPRRMPQRALVHQPAPRTHRYRNLAPGIQRGATEKSTWRTDPNAYAEQLAAKPTTINPGL